MEEHRRAVLNHVAACSCRACADELLIDVVPCSCNSQRGRDDMRNSQAPHNERVQQGQASLEGRACPEFPVPEEITGRKGKPREDGYALIKHQDVAAQRRRILSRGKHTRGSPCWGTPDGGIGAKDLRHKSCIFRDNSVNQLQREQGHIRMSRLSKRGLEKQTPVDRRRATSHWAPTRWSAQQELIDTSSSP